MEANRRSAFGIALRQFREASGLSQEQLAERAGLSLRGISDLERGLRMTPRLETVRMIADGLGLTPAQRAELVAARGSNQHQPATSLSSLQARLPVPLTSFVGREPAIREIVELIEADDVRLITLTGPGGVGKTRIAIEVAHRKFSTFRNGAIFVDLAAIRDPGLVIGAIADRLGVRGQGEMEIGQVLAVALQGQQVLMVLDNLEQVVESASQITRLLDQCPELTIIATTRVVLRVAAEHVVTVDPMSLPTGDDMISLTESEAATLFVARAHTIDQHFVLDHANAATVRAIVDRLQGMPLAIELATARLRLLSLDDLLQRLNAQLSVLAGGARDAPDRQRTMRATISWSYDLLSPAEKLVLRSLSIFPDGCTLETAISMMGHVTGFTEDDTITALESLVDSNLLRRRPGASGEMRYRMLQTVREYGMERLATAGEETKVRRAAHDAWALPLARRGEFLMAEPDEVLWLNRIAAEYQGLREHMAWLVARDHVEDALAISGPLSHFRVLRWHLEDGSQELESFLRHPDTQRPTASRMTGWIGLGQIYNQQGNFGRALEACQAGIAIARTLGAQRHLALGLNLAGVALFYTGQIDEAERHYKEAARVAEAIDDSFFIQCTMHGQAAIADHRGELQESRRLLERVLHLCESYGHVWGLALCKHNLGYQCIRRGELDEAERLVLEAQDAYALLEGRPGSPGLYLTLADIARLRNDHAKAEMMLERALGIAREDGSILDVAYSQLGLARDSAHGGDLSSTLQYAQHALKWYERSGSAVEAVRSLEVLADIAVASGDAVRAAWCIGAIDAALEKPGVHRTQLESGAHQARIENVTTLLGDEGFHTHYACGHSMPVERIMNELQSWH